MLMLQNINPWRSLAKGLGIFLILEFAFVNLHPDLSQINVYGTLVPKRERFPISTHAPEDAALDVGNLDAMFASHIVSEPKPENEFRVLVLGDSAVWGDLLDIDQTLPAQLNQLGLSCAGRQMRFYNLSYPRSSATKDLMILDKGMHYQPDMVLWVVTLYTLMPKSRTDHWLIGQNPGELYQLNDRYQFLPKKYPAQSPWSKWLEPQIALMHILRYQLYAAVPLATREEQLSPSQPIPVPVELSSDQSFEGMRRQTLKPGQLTLDEVEDALQIAGNLPFLLVNEPMQIVQGQPNSDIRYNAYYPRWVYDQYRQLLGQAAASQGWNYLDLWDRFPSNSFSDTPLHLTPEGEQQMAQVLAPAIEKACP